MRKVALLIGISDYEPGLNPLPASVKDMEAIAKVLQHPEMGGFAQTDIQKLENPDPQKMQEAIETLFSDRRKDDLVVLYFSGHGIKDESGKLHLATRLTRKNPQGRLIKSTTVPASFVHNIMSESHCKRQVVILDCCFSGAFAEGWSAKDDSSVDIRAELGGEGRVVLTSSTATEYSFHQQESNLSIYTRYLIEGIETGAADLDNDGAVSVDELHEYAKKKVQEAAPAMQPEIYAVKEGFKILLSKAPIGDPKLKYRKEIEIYASRGEISIIGRRILDALRQNLGLFPEETAAIEAEVLKPYREYQQKLQQYEQALVDAIGREPTLSDHTRNDLRRYQEILGLRDEDIASIETKISPQNESVIFRDKVIASKSISHKDDVTPVTTSNKAIAASETETIAPSIIKSPSILATSVAVVRNFRVMIGAGILATVVLTFSFLVKPRDASVTTPSQVESSTLSVTPTISPTTEMSAKNFYDRGLEKSTKKDHKGAIEDFNEVLRLDPNFTLAYYKRGDARSALKDYKGGIEDLNQYIRINPKDANSYVSRGWAYYNLYNYKQATIDYNKAIEINPKHALAHNNRGAVYADQGNYEQAISDYTKAIEFKNDPLKWPYYNRGDARRNLGDNKGAIEDYNQAIRIDPTYTNAYNNRGLAYANLKDYKKAIDDYSQAIRIDSNYVYAYYNRGNTRSIIKDKQGAIADYQIAANLYQKQENTKQYQQTLEKLKELQK
ncbi:tetratricopeptide repeat protein [Komarekiella sp. 'clone 1']|uniref:Tetratricopeptide repeat protein n=1 Tax=Komarekiella delphini-convector SJRDD-AB1 TaxID=2593771 RepID=A0AA40VRP6_9NOST|nr:tetratricopeptide repeat protein [Komarekiella delphini-convector]MBD6617102.1 tetratricopeptide repeat protein [Komarekiella delphini-convector SJRDD-AB1]